MKKINSLESIRFYLALSIFLCHLDTVLVSTEGKYIYESFFHNGNFAVTFFFVLSGFCMALGYSERFSEINKKGFYDFIKRRLRKIYPLYLITMLLAMLCNIVMNFSPSGILRNVAHYLLGATMLQTLTVKYWGILNSVCWYISSIFVIYLVTPFIIRKMHSVKNHKKKLLKISVIAFGMLIVLILAARLILSKETWELTIYVSPFFRIFYYFIGLVLGYIRKLQPKAQGAYMGRLEGLLAIGVCIVYFMGMQFDLLNPYVSLLYLLVFGMFIYVLSYEEGIISKFLGNKVNIELGGLSMEFFMLHYLLVHYGGMLVWNKFQPALGMEVLVSVLLFVITYVMVLLYKKISKFLWQ